MANEIKDFKVDQKSREVIVYSKGISDQKFNEVKRFKEMGYKITMLKVLKVLLWIVVKPI